MHKKLLVFFFIFSLLLTACTSLSEPFQIHFESNGGSLVESITIGEDASVTMPENPTRDGYTFDGWYVDDETFENPFHADSLIAEYITGDITLYAKWVPIDIEAVLANYTDGINLSSLSAESRGTIFAALEQYLLENVYGGVPLFTGANYTAFSVRTEVFSETYNAVMGYGEPFSTLTADDSTVKMYGDTYGNTGEYTWRDSFTLSPYTFNHWTANDSNNDEFIAQFTGSLYDFRFDSTKTIFEMVPSLAASDPIPVDGYELNGKTYASTWQIPIRDDLEWAFHPDTDLTLIEELNPDYEVLDANDWLWTWKVALENRWFRAISGGLDFITTGVFGAEEYANDQADWSDVGLSVIDGNTLQIEYKTDKSAFDIKYIFSSSVLSPVQPELRILDESYGEGPEHVASSGAYVLNDISDELITYTKNELHPEADLYHFTGLQYQYVLSKDHAFTLYEDELLDVASVPTDRIEDYYDNSNVCVSPQATTWRLMINGFGTEENRDAYIEQYPELGLSEVFVPEPILQYTAMRQALFYGVDRQSASEDNPVYLPAWTYYNELYYLDAESGLSVRDYEDGQETLEMFGGSSAGYLPEQANALFVEAVGEALADGFYADANPTSTDYYEIHLDFQWMSSGNVYYQAIVNQMMAQLEEVLIDDEHYFKVIFDMQDIVFPTSYYASMLTADADLGISGISAAAFYASDFMDIFRDDNYAGFTMNWGIDTHTPNIEVMYENLEGVIVNEIWSFNALSNALNRKTYVKDGDIQYEWIDPEDLIKAYLDIQGSSLVSFTGDDEDIASYLRDDLDELGYQNVVSFIAESSDGYNYLFILGFNGVSHEFIDQIPLFMDAHESIERGLRSYGYTIVVSNPELLDDAGVLANPYIAGNYGFETVEEVAEACDAPIEYAEVWAIDWYYSSSASGSDAVLLLHINDYYIFWEWL